MKKISEWLDDLPDGYRELAVENWFTNDYADDIETPTIRGALRSAFPWYKSNEGRDFWADVHSHYENRELLPPLPAENNPPITASPFTQDAETRKQHPVYSGFVAYFPDAMAKVSNISWEGNEQHHPGTPLHWDRSKSADESDAMMRHLIDYTKSGDIEELAKMVWRGMAWLQKEIE